MVTGGSSFPRPLFAFPGEDWLEGGAGRAALARVSDSLASGRACQLLIQELSVSGDRPAVHTLPHWECGMSGEFSVDGGLPPTLPWATLSAPPACMEWGFG